MFKKFTLLFFLIWLSRTTCLQAQRINNYNKPDSCEAGNFLIFKPRINYYKSYNDFKYSFDVSKLPFFCKIEHKIEAKSKIPFRFRIGDLNYVNMLENKK